MKRTVIKKWDACRTLLLDSGNNMFVLIEPGKSLRLGVSRLQALVEAKGNDLCVGQVHLVTFGELPIRLCMRKRTKRKEGCSWDVFLAE